jgi:hypothetical protein
MLATNHEDTLRETHEGTRLEEECLEREVCLWTGSTTCAGLGLQPLGNLQDVRPARLQHDALMSAGHTDIVAQLNQ